MVRREDRLTPGGGTRPFLASGEGGTVAGTGLVVSIALPPEQRGDPLAVPVEIRFVVAPTVEDSPASAAAPGTTWSVARGPQDYRTTNELLNRLGGVQVGGVPLGEFMAFRGVSMWQFLVTDQWSSFFLVVELIRVLQGIADGVAISQLRVFPADDPLTDLWEGVTSAFAGRLGVPVSMVGHAPRDWRSVRRRLITPLIASPAGPPLRRMRDVASSESRFIARSARIARRAGNGSEGSGAGRKLVFASISRHWMVDPTDPSRKYDEQFYPLISALRQRGWSRFVGIDCPYSHDTSALVERTRAAGPGIVWRSFHSYRRPRGTRADRGRRTFLEMWAELRADAGFVSDFCYEGVPLMPALEERLESAFWNLLPRCAVALSTAGRIIEEEAPDAVIATYEVGPFQRALVIEADRRGVPVVGLQHGMILDYHYDYMHSRVSTSPATDMSSFAIPKLTCVWGPAWKRVLTQHGAYPENAVAITGNWRYDAVLERRVELRSAFREQLGILVDERVVLILSACQCIETYIRECLGIVADLPGWRPLIKLHPADDAAPIRDLLQHRGYPQSMLITGNMIPAVLGADLVVSQISTAITEAVLLNRPVILANFEDVAGAESYVEAGICEYITQPQQLPGAMFKLVEDETRRSEVVAARERFVADYFYNTDGRAAQRVAAELESLVFGRS